MPVKPWAPIFSVERSAQQEVLIEGVIKVVAGLPDGTLRTALSVGDDKFAIWTRSILKPWQTLANFPYLKEAYPDLLPQHFAMMAASHSADVEHLCLLRQIMDIGGVKEEQLKCPAAMPKEQRLRFKFERDGEPARPLFHNCSGKHLGYLLAIKAQNIKTENYLDPEGAQHKPLLSVLTQLTGRSVETFVPTVDGCQLPNYSLTAIEAAGMYLSLLNSSYLPSAQISDAGLAPNLLYVGKLMNAYANLIDGQDTLDSEIMKGRFLKEGVSAKLVAKFGAEGMLAASLGSTKLYPNGAGIFIKLAYGMSAPHLEVIFKELLRQMGLADDTADGAASHLKTTFYFRLSD